MPEDPNPGGTSHIRLTPDDMQDPRGFVNRLMRKLDLLEGDVPRVASAAGAAAANAAIAGRPGTPGVAGPPGPPGGSGTPAPNVTADGPTFSWRLSGHDTLPVFEGTITLPTADPDYTDHFMQVIVFAIDPTTEEWIELTRYAKPADSSGTISYSGWNQRITQKAAAQTGWKMRFQAINENAAPTANPYAIDDITIPAASVTSLVGADLAGERWLELPGRSVHLVLEGTISCANYPVYLTIWTNDGTSPKWHEWIEIDSAATVFKIGAEGTNTILFAPAVAGNWTIIAALGTYGNDEQPPVDAFTSAPFAVAAMGKPLATDVTSLSVSAPAAGADPNWPYNRITPDQVQDWNIPSITWDDTGASADINAAFAILTVTDLDASHNPVGPEVRYGVVSINEPSAPHARDWGNLSGQYGTAGYRFTRTGNIAYNRLKLYLVSRLDVSETSWENADCSTQQTGIGGGLGYVDVLVAAGGTPPTSEIAGTPPAPNITGATLDALTYQPWAHLTAPVFSGTISLPTTDPNYADHFAFVVVYARTTADVHKRNAMFEICRYDKPTDGSTTVSYSGWSDKVLQTGSDQTGWQLVFVAYNEDYAPTPSPYVISGITIPAYGLSGIVGADDTADRWVDQNRSVYAPLAVTITATNYPQTVTVWMNDGSGNKRHGWYSLKDGAAFKIGLKNGPEIIFAPAADASWTLKAAIGAWEGSDTDGWRCAELGVGPVAIASIPGLVTSDAFPVVSMQKPLATDVAALTISAGIGGNFPYNRIWPDGMQDWNIDSIGWDDTTAANDPNAAFAILTVTDLDASHNPVGAEVRYGVVQVGQPTDSHTRDWGNLSGQYGTVGYRFTRSGNIAYNRLKLYLVSRLDMSEASYQNPACSTQQNLAGVGYIDVLVATGGAIPAGAIPGSRISSKVASATTADSATTANTATTAGSATTAGFANSAGTVPWGGVSGPLNVGGGGSAQTVVQWTNAAGSVIAWAGKKNWGGVDYYGLWALNFWAGGTGPTDPRMWIDASGNAHFNGVIETSTTISAGVSISAPVINGGSLTINTAQGTVSISNSTNGVQCVSGSTSGSLYAGVLVISNGVASALVNATTIVIQYATVANQVTVGGSSLTTNALSTAYGVFSSSVSCNGLTVGGGGLSVSGSVSLSGTFSGTHSGTWNGSISPWGVSCPGYGITCYSLAVGAGGLNVNGAVGMNSGALHFQMVGGGGQWMRWDNGILTTSYVG